MTNIFLYLLPLSLKACVVIPLIIAVRFAIQRQPKIYSYLLWVVVFAGLVFNLRIDSPFADYNLVGNIASAVDSRYNELMDDYVGDIKIYHDNTIEYYTAIEKGITPVYIPEEGTRYVVTEGGTITAPPTFASRTVPKLAVVWLVGLIVILCAVAKSWRSFRKSFSTVERQNKIVYISGVNSPFVWGILKPVICIPYNMKDNLPQSVISHERLHIHRGDHIIKPLCLAITAVHWFNPLVWLAFRLMCRDMEMSCDEWVIAENHSKKEYSLQLLQCASEKQPAQAMTVLFGESDAEKRIKNVLAYKQPAKIISVLLVAVVAVLSTACMVQEKVEEIIPSPVPQTFYEQLAQLNSTENVQYRERELIEGIYGTKNTDILPVAQMNVTTKIPPEITEASYQFYGAGYNGITGTVTQTENGPVSTFAYVVKNSEKLHLCTATETDYTITTLDMPQGHSLHCVATGREVLADNIEFLSYYTKDTDDQLWLNIHKIKDGKTEIYQHKMSNDNSFILRGLRFINENVGFMGQTERGRYDVPQASITIDGGKTWQKLNFSALTAPQYFTSYRSCCMDSMDNMIEIRYFTYINLDYKEKMQGVYDFSTSAESYSIISEDGGLTWAGYLRVRNKEKGYGYSHQKVTDTIPVRILTQ